MKEPKFIRFVPVERSVESSAYWTVQNKKHGDDLGVVEWYSVWRQYTFSAEPGAIFSHDCLNDIAAFCLQKTNERKAK